MGMRSTLSVSEMIGFNAAWSGLGTLAFNPVQRVWGACAMSAAGFVLE